MRIIDFLPHGKNNAINGSDLEILLGVNGRTLKGMIANERLNGAVICSILDGNNGGYFIPDSPSEAVEYVRTEQKRIESAKAALKAAEEFIKGGI